MRRTFDKTQLGAWEQAGEVTAEVGAEILVELAERQREQALQDVAGPLRALYDWRPPSFVAARLGPPSPSTDPLTIVGATILPLPLERVRHLVAPAVDRAPGHRATIEEAWSWVIDHADLLPRLDDPADVVTHGDLHLDNVWWDGNRVTGPPRGSDLHRFRPRSDAGPAGTCPWR